MQAWSHGHQLVHSHVHLTCIPWEEWQIRRSKPNEENPEEIELVISQKCMPLSSKGSRPRCVPKPASPKNTTGRARSGPTATYYRKKSSRESGEAMLGEKKNNRGHGICLKLRGDRRFLKRHFPSSSDCNPKAVRLQHPICARSSPVPKAGNNHTSTKPAVGYIDPGFYCGRGAGGKSIKNKQTNKLIKEWTEWVTE